MPVNLTSLHVTSCHVALRSVFDGRREEQGKQEQEERRPKRRQVRTRVDAVPPLFTKALRRLPQG